MNTKNTIIKSLLTISLIAVTCITSNASAITIQDLHNSSEWYQVTDKGQDGYINIKDFYIDKYGNRYIYKASYSPKENVILITTLLVFYDLKNKIPIAFDIQSLDNPSSNRYIYPVICIPDSKGFYGLSKEEQLQLKQAFEVQDRYKK